MTVRIIIRNWHDWWNNTTNDNDRNVDTTVDDDDDVYETVSSSSTVMKITSKQKRYHHLQQHKLLLDIRTNDEYEQRHFISNRVTTPSIVNRLTVVHIPYDELLNRRFELPPRNIPFAILASTTSLSIDEDTNHDEHNNNNNNNNNHSIVEEDKSKIHSGQKRPSTATTVSNDTQTIVVSSIVSLLSSWNIVAIFDANDETIWSSIQNESNISIYESNKYTTNITNNNSTTTTITVMQRQQDDEQQQQYESSLSVPTFNLPLPRLWYPDPMIEHIVVPMLHEKLVYYNNNYDNNHDTNNVIMEIWDLGSGLGRDVCYIAEELLYNHHRYNDNNNHNNNINTNNNNTRSNDQLKVQNSKFHIIGYDQRYRNTNQNDTIQFWKRRYVDTITSCYCLDINTIQNIHDLKQFLLVQQQQEQHLTCKNHNTTVSNNTKRYIGCIYAVRYWNKSFIQAIIDLGLQEQEQQQNNDNDATNDTNHNGIDSAGNKSTTQQPFCFEIGTIIAISHFCKPSLSVSEKWNFDHPKEQYVLERNELRNMFVPVSSTCTVYINTSVEQQQQQQRQSKRIWNIIHDEIVIENDPMGRTLIQFVAQLATTE